MRKKLIQKRGGKTIPSKNFGGILQGLAGMAGPMSGAFGGGIGNNITGNQFGDLGSLIGMGKNKSQTPLTSSQKGEILSQAAGSGLGVAFNAYNTFDNINNSGMNSDQKRMAKGDAGVGVASQVAGMFGPVGSAIGTSLGIVNKLGGALIGTPKALKDFKVNDQVSSSSAFTGVADSANSMADSANSYKNAGLAGKLFGGKNKLVQKATQSNMMQSRVSDLLDSNKKLKDQAAASQDAIATKVNAGMTFGNGWNNGTIQFGRTGTKLVKHQQGGNVSFINYKPNPQPTANTIITEPTKAYYNNTFSNATKTYKLQKNDGSFTNWTESPKEGYNSTFLARKRQLQDMIAQNGLRPKVSDNIDDPTSLQVGNQASGLIAMNEQRMQAYKDANREVISEFNNSQPFSRESITKLVMKNKMTPTDTIGMSHVNRQDFQDALDTKMMAELKKKNKGSMIVSNQSGGVVERYKSIAEASKKFNVTRLTKELISRLPKAQLIEDLFEEVDAEEPAEIEIEMFKDGGAINVIVDGELHARKHKLKEIEELSNANITLKGVPVITMEEGGEITQHAEVEKDELILHHGLTKKLEDLIEEDDDEAAIQAGRIFAKELVRNTRDSKSKLLKDDNDKNKR